MKLFSRLPSLRSRERAPQEGESEGESLVSQAWGEGKIDAVAISSTLDFTSMHIVFTDRATDDEIDGLVTHLKSCCFDEITYARVYSYER
jgi:hypothetical protein